MINMLTRYSGRNHSSIVFEVIKTISSLFIYLFYEKILSKKKAQKRKQTIFTFLEVFFVRPKICCLCCFLFACFCFVSWCLLCLFLCAQNLFIKKKTKKNRLEIVLTTSNTILLMCTPINTPMKNLFVHTCTVYNKNL